MTPPPYFPVLPGQGWSVHKKPLFSTLVASHTSGREVRSALFTEPLYDFELVIDGLSSGTNYPGLGNSSLQSLMGLYLECEGSFGTFLYDDPTDNVAQTQLIGAGDGTATDFTFKRTIGSATTAVSWVEAVDAVKLDNVTASGWTLVQPNTLAFSVPPASGSIITADFSYAFLCRFLDDQIDFENVQTGLWTIGSVKFRSVKP